MDALQMAEIQLHKLTTGRATASLPIQALLRVCLDQQEEIDGLRRRIEDLELERGGSG